MSRTFNVILLSLFLAACFITTSKAQSEISSPYSSFGVGVLTNTANGTMASMGGVSYAMQSNLFINYKNPASYVAFDSLSFLGDVSFSLISNTLTTSQLTQGSSTARFNYLMLGLPVTRHWRTSAGILPFSDIGYKIQDVQGDRNYSYNGDGGLMQLYWGNAFKICKGLSIGINMSYLFGSLNNLRYIEITGDNFLNTRIAQSTFIDGIYLSGGIQYFTTIKEKHRLGFGLVYENSAYIWAKENLFINNYTGVYNSNNIYDTVLYKEGEKGRLIIPQSIGFGITYSNSNKILVGADVTWQNWSKYRLMGRNDSLQNAFVAAVGLQYTPNPLSSKYINRMHFRVGGRFSTGYLHLNNTDIREFAVSLGVGFPLRTFTTQSTINLMLEYGQTGTILNELIRQNYFKLTLNFILHEKWYQRVRLE